MRTAIRWGVPTLAAVALAVLLGTGWNGERGARRDAGQQAAAGHGADGRAAAAAPEATAQAAREPEAPEQAQGARKRPAATAGGFVEAVVRRALPPPADMNEPYPFERGQARRLEPEQVLELLERFYGPDVPAGMRLEALHLPGDGRFELDVELAAEAAALWPGAGPGRLRLEGRVRAERSMAEVRLDAAVQAGRKLTLPAEAAGEDGSLRLDVPLPPGLDGLRLEAGGATANPP